MPRMNELIGHNLKWEQPSASKLEYELRAGDFVTGKMHMPSSFKSIASASNNEGEWVFDRVGFWQRKATVRARDGISDLAIFQYNTWSGGGTLNTSNGRVFRAASNFWATRYTIHDEMDQELIRYTRIGGVFHASCEVEILPSAGGLAELSWLVPFGWYLVVMMLRDSGAAAAA